MAGRKSDRRVKYTKMVLQESLLGLLKEKPLKAITVKELCERADVSRGAFYAHYSDPFDLLRQIENEYMEQIGRSITQEKNADMGELICEVFNILSEKNELSKIVLSETGSIYMAEQLSQIGRAAFDNQWKDSPLAQNTDTLDFIYAFVVGGCVGMLQEWTSHDMKPTPDAIGGIAQTLMLHGINGFVDEGR